MQVQYTLTQDDIKRAVQQYVSVEHDCSVGDVKVNLNVSPSYTTSDPRESGAASVSAIAEIEEQA